MIYDHASFSPLLVSEPGVSDIKLVEQLKELERELTGRPLKVNWLTLSPTQVEARGILDDVDHVKRQIARLPQRHRQEAALWLGKVRSNRQLAETEIPSFLTELYQYVTTRAEEPGWPGQDSGAGPAELTGVRLFADIDARLAQAQDALNGEQYLAVLEQVSQIWQDVETVRAFLQAMNAHGRQQAKIDALLAQGGHPLQLAEDWQEIKLDVQTITARILAGDYAHAAPWIEELNTDSRRALAGVQGWQALREHNLADLHYLHNRVSQLAQWQQEQVEPAWQQLQAYPGQNWADLAPEMEQARQSLTRLLNSQLKQLESLNSLDVQQFIEAERLLKHTLADLARVEEQFHTTVNRLAEVQAVAERISQALPLAETDLQRAETLRNQEDVKIGPEVDRQIEQAHRHLAKAKRLAETGDFRAALDEQVTARQLATAAYMAADDQVRRINVLQVDLEHLVGRAREKTQQYLATIKKLPAVAQTDATQQLARQLREQLSRAEQARTATIGLEDQALAQALQTARDAYDEVDQLAAWTLRQVKADGAEYNEHLKQALAAISNAQAAIRQAEQVVLEADASGAGQHALERAQATLPAEASTRRATVDSLVYLREQAEEASRYATLARNQAGWRQKTRLAQARQNLQEETEIGVECTETLAVEYLTDRIEEG
ncbi:MAG: hypothetical protein JW953_22455 [Anaerolineae bacterium]|nr:hypothetical protein [Anaerolineae bacterium]